jgi:hypothetical protein
MQCSKKNRQVIHRAQGGYGLSSCGRGLLKIVRTLSGQYLASESTRTPQLSIGQPRELRRSSEGITSGA